MAENERPLADDVALPEVKVLRLQPGDVIVAKLDDRVTHEQLQHIELRMRDLFPKHQVVFCQGVELEIARQSDGHGGSPMGGA